jgi:hypothetical protein
MFQMAIANQLALGMLAQPTFAMTKQFLLFGVANPSSTCRHPGPESAHKDA